MAKLNIPKGGDDGGGKKKFVLPGGGAGEAKSKLVVPGGGGGGVGPAAKEVPSTVPDEAEFGEIEPSAGDDFLILEEAPTEEAPVEPVHVAAMSAPEPELEPEVYAEEVAEPAPVAEARPVKISSMAPPVEAEEEEAVEAVEYEEPVAEAEPIAVPAAGAPRLVVPPVAAVPPAQTYAPPVQQYAPPQQASAPPAGYGYPPQGAMPPGAVPGMEGQTTLLHQTGYQPVPHRMVPGWALMLVGILLGMVITILAVKFSPLGEMLVGRVMTLDEVGYEE